MCVHEGSRVFFCYSFFIWEGKKALASFFITLSTCSFESRWGFSLNTWVFSQPSYDLDQPDRNKARSQLSGSNPLSPPPFPQAGVNGIPASLPPNLDLTA